MNIILLGPPGSGKGTQAASLAQHWQVPTISTGELLRAEVKAGSDLGQKVGDLMTQGLLVPDDLIIAIMMEKLTQKECAQGVILDGFPRTVAQAVALDQQCSVDAVVSLCIDNEEIVGRMAGRLYHPASGRVYHKVFNPPKRAGIDDQTGESLVLRSDDQPDTVRRRLDVYHAQTQPVLDHYRQFSYYYEVDATLAVEQVTASILSQVHK